MGRSGGGGGGHHSSGHSGSHHGSFHSGSGGRSFGGSSYHGGGNRSGGYRSTTHVHHHYHTGSGYRNYGPRYRDYGPGTPPPPPGPRGSSGSGCGAIIVLAIFFIILSVMFSAVKGGTVNENNMSEYAEKQYQKIFDGREDCLLIVLDENDDGQIKYGAKANYIMDRYQDDLWNYYDMHYNDDLGIQLKGMFDDTANLIAMDNIQPLNPSKSFDSHCYRDDINWVDTKGNLVDGAQHFYEVTGIQTYVLLVKAKTIAKATNKSSGILKVVIICGAAIIIVMIAFKWWKKKVAQKNKEQEDLEKVLSTPLETFGSPLSDLEKKYDDNDSNSTS